MESELKVLKKALDVKVKFVESFKIGKSGKTISEVNQDYCHPLYFFPEYLCESCDINLIDRLERILIKYAKTNYPDACENKYIDSSFEMTDNNKGSYMIYVAIRKP